MAEAETTVGNNWEQLLLAEGFCSKSVRFPVYGTVNVPEFLGKLAKLNSNYVSTEMLLAHERYAAQVIFLGGQVYKNELLARLHSCG
jgi:hypothetical protein